MLTNERKRIGFVTGGGKNLGGSSSLRKDKEKFMQKSLTANSAYVDAELRQDGSTQECCVLKFGAKKNIVAMGGDECYIQA